MPTVKSRQRTKIALVIEGSGFWIAVESGRTYSFRAQYFAIGSAGHQISGESSGFSGLKGGWTFTSVPFRVLKVGLLNMTLVESKRKVRVSTPEPIAFPRQISGPSGSRGSGLNRTGRIELIPTASGRTRRVKTGSGHGRYGYEYAYAYGYEGAPTPKKRRGTRRGRRKQGRKKRKK